MNKNKTRPDKQHRYPWPVIESAVLMYLRDGLTFRAVSEKMLVHGVVVSHKTIFEWVRKFSKNVASQQRKHYTTYEIEESQVKCNGEWMYMYRAVNRSNVTLSVYLRERRNLAQARAFFRRELERR